MKKAETLPHNKSLFLNIQPREYLEEQWIRNSASPQAASAGKSISKLLQAL
ncbi:MAG: hypothetical protein PHC92_12120 [Syntrophomonadaceae bacterium]|nr:hypothetical protein [Syntrophomonadaceae bacterium]